MSFLLLLFYYSWKENSLSSVLTLYFAHHLILIEFLPTGWIVLFFGNKWQIFALSDWNKKRSNKIHLQMCLGKSHFFTEVYLVFQLMCFSLDKMTSSEERVSFTQHSYFFRWDSWVLVRGSYSAWCDKTRRKLLSFLCGFTSSKVTFQFKLKAFPGLLRQGCKANIVCFST